mgnify:CR=1 FL=1
MNSWSFDTGDNEFSEILDGCLESMHMKELCHIILSLSDKPNCESLQVDSSNILMCELELLEFSQVSWNKNYSIINIFIIRGEKK